MFIKIYQKEKTVKKYDRFSTLMYAIGRAIETEDDEEVREQLEDLEEKMGTSIRIVSERKVREILNR